MVSWSKFGSMKMTSLTNNIAQKLKYDIIAGIFAADSKLKLSDLKFRYQVGTSPIREALFTLTLSGLVTNNSQKGFTVAPLTSKDLTDLYGVRLLTDKEAIRLSCEFGDTEWESNILTAYHSLQKVELQSKITDYFEWENSHKTFHKSLISGCRSTKLIELFDLYYDQALRYRKHWFKTYGKKNISYEKHHCEHKKLMNAALKHDGELASKLLEKHYQKITNTIKKIL